MQKEGQIEAEGENEMQIRSISKINRHHSDITNAHTYSGLNFASMFAIQNTNPYAWQSPTVTRPHA